jgi:hypothetical protein
MQRIAGAKTCPERYYSLPAVIAAANLELTCPRAAMTVRPLALLPREALPTRAARTGVVTQV